ncbi:hypothetical protein [Methylobacterium sp. 77]|uniref:hypothetical protein n=1 Tax=Methylobacterium sp. 77 TaxID=1101192 RepID=UPI001FD8E2B4|nr:hypothetical protein [Methylobacterium sp. 77]
MGSSVLLAVCLPSFALAQTGGTARQPAVLLHGHYCGLGNDAPLPPIDAVDAACARHDACVPNGGLPARACNLRLQREMAFLSRDRNQPDDLRALAAFIAAGAAVLPFDPHGPDSVVGAPVPAGTGWYRPGAYRFADHPY